ncbi:DNA topoisomerase, partial [Escherichia coli]|nr:DNA topoisomerase [Escherichia coli]
SVGRVQTPTLFMIYQREKDIENFVPKPFYELEGAVTHSNGGFNVKGNIKVDQKQDALDLLRKHQILLNTPKETTISRVIETVEKESSPRLYTLSTIQT